MSTYHKIFRPQPGRFGIVPTFVTAALAAITPNTTTTTHVPTPRRKAWIERITYSAVTVADDPDGTVLLTVKKWDDSAQAAVSLTAATSIEGLTARRATEIAILSTLTVAQRLLDEGDTLFVEIVNNSAALTSHANAFVTAELLPTE